jgi:hypothetical protein
MEGYSASFELFIDSLTEEQLMFLACTFGYDLPSTVNNLGHFITKRATNYTPEEIKQITQRARLMFSKKLYH